MPLAPGSRAADGLGQQGARARIGEASDGMSWSRAAMRIAAYVVIGLGTAAIRLLGLTGFSNDHYVALAGAQQMLFGEWPTRDFLDPGLPLMYAASAAAQFVFGRNLFAEAMLVSCAFGLAAALT